MPMWDSSSRDPAVKFGIPSRTLQGYFWDGNAVSQERSVSCRTPLSRSESGLIGRRRPCAPQRTMGGGGTGGRSRAGPRDISLEDILRAVLDGSVISKRTSWKRGEAIYTGPQPGCSSRGTGGIPPRRLLSGCGFAVCLDIHRSGVAPACLNGLEA